LDDFDFRPWPARTAPGRGPAGMGTAISRGRSGALLKPGHGPGRRGWSKVS